MLIPLGFLAASGVSAGSFDLLETQVLGTAAASVTFSSLSTYAATYQHLQIRAVVRTSRATTSDVIQLRFNSDSGNNYAQHGLYGNGSIVGSYAGVPRSAAFAMESSANNTTANVFGAAVMDILDPFETTKNTTFRTMNGVTSYNVISLASSLWNNTAAITTMTFTSDGGANFVSGTRFSLYGIKVN
jgi:hypothetical protein